MQYSILWNLQILCYIEMFVQFHFAYACLWLEHCYFECCLQLNTRVILYFPFFIFKISAHSDFKKKGYLKGYLNVFFFKWTIFHQFDPGNRFKVRNLSHFIIFPFNLFRLNLKLLFYEMHWKWYATLWMFTSSVTGSVKWCMYQSLNVILNFSANIYSMMTNYFSLEWEFLDMISSISIYTLINMLIHIYQSIKIMSNYYINKACT